MHDLSSDPFVTDGLELLTREAFGPAGFARGAREVVQVLVHRGSSTLGHGYLLPAGGGPLRNLEDRKEEFSYEGLIVWLDEHRSRAYEPGSGTWTTAEVHVYPDRPGTLKLFDEEILKKLDDGRWYPGAEPANAALWARQLLAYPRTADRIPGWMWDIFSAEAVEPPLYHPGSGSVDWNNRRYPVADWGTDFSATATVIDPGREPNLLTRIGNTLFGRGKGPGAAS